MPTETNNNANNPSGTKAPGRTFMDRVRQYSSAAERVSEVNGKKMFRMLDGKVIEMPKDMTVDEAIKLEADALAAQKKLGKLPPPKVLPDVEAKAKGKDKKVGKGDAPKMKKAGIDKPGKGKHGAGSKASKHVIKGKVGAWLMAKGAPVVMKGQQKLQQLKQNEQTHDDAAQKLSQTEKAQVQPPSEAQSTSTSGQVSNVDAKPAPQPSEANAKQSLNQAIQDNIPTSIEEVDSFKRSNKAGAMSSAAAISITTDKNAVSGTFNEMGQTPAPAPTDVKPEALPPEEIAPVTAKMNLGTDTIAPLQKEHTDVSNFTKDADNKLKEEGVTQEQLDMVDSGDLATANKEKKGMEKKAKEEPVAINQFAKNENKKVDTELQKEENKGRDEIKNKRKQHLSATKQKQQGTKSELEKKRDEVANKINAIYTRAQTSVTKKLADLETQSMKRFDDGNAKATREFEDNVKNELDAFKDDRYSGMFGWARKAKDWLLGMDDLPQVKAIFDRNRTAFVNTVNKLVEEISADNKKVVQGCKDELANAKKEIKDYVDKLGPALKDAGKKAQEEMNGKLEALDQMVAQKEQELADKLKDKQQAAIKAIDEKIEKMKEEMSGALGKLGKLLLLAAKKFFTWALEKAGFSLAEIEGIINKGAAVLKAIFTQPIQFVKNLMNAAITGFKNFGKNFLTHLKNALFEWLTGSLEGLVLPQTWDFKGIIGVALQMIGISYANIRKHMVTEMTEPVVAGLEKTFTLVKTLITEGPMAAWDQLKEMAGEMRDAFIEAVKDFIKTKIIEQAIQWVVSIFVPGAGIVKAIIGIYDTVMFFIQKAKQIMQMISNFLGSISEIAAGNIGAAADAMENGLARGLSLVINFMAKLLRLDGITSKIQAAIKKIRDKVDAVLAKVAKWIADKAKKIWGAVKQGAADLRDGVTEWWKTKRPFTDKAGKKHNIYLEGSENNAKVIIASVPEEALLKLKQKHDTATEADKPKIAAAKTEIEKIYADISVIKAAKGGRKDEKAREINVLIDRAKNILMTLDIDGDAVDFEPEYAFQGSGPYTVLPGQVRKGTFKTVNPKNKVAYMAMVPMYVGNAKTVASIADVYRTQAFAPAGNTDGSTASESRFAMVVGINRSEGATDEEKQQVRKDMKTKIDSIGAWPNKNFPVGVFGFTFPEKLIEKGTGRVVTSIKEEEAKAPPQKKAKIKQAIQKAEEKKVETEKVIPYGTFRGAIQQHSFTSSFIDELNRRSEAVFAQLGDPDNVSFKVASSDVLTSDDVIRALFDPAFAKAADGLFIKYDKKLEEFKATHGKYPDVITGGYYMDMTAKEITSDNHKLATLAASMLDMKVRQGIAKINPKCAYFPEPNTMFNVTGDNKNLFLSTRFNPGRNESRGFMNNHPKAGTLSGAFVPAEMITGFAPRFEVKVSTNLTAAVEGGFILGFLHPDISRLRTFLSSGQSHADERGWVTNVAAGYGLVIGRISADHSNNWYHALQVIYQAAMGPVMEILNGENSAANKPDITAAELADVFAKCKARINFPKTDWWKMSAFLKEYHPQLSSTEVREQVIAMAKSTAETICTFYQKGLKG